MNNLSFGFIILSIVIFLNIILMISKIIKIKKINKIYITILSVKNIIINIVLIIVQE
jgi:hypothetical protein